MTPRIAALAALTFALHASSFDGPAFDGAAPDVGDGAGWAAQPRATPPAATTIVTPRNESLILRQASQ